MGSQGVQYPNNGGNRRPFCPGGCGRRVPQSHMLCRTCREDGVRGRVPPPEEPPTTPDELERERRILGYIRRAELGKPLHDGRRHDGV